MYEQNKTTATATPIAGLNSPVTVYQSVRAKKGKVTTLGKLLEAMKDPKRRGQAEKLRTAKESDPVAYGKLKDKLPGFSIGNFDQRKDESCVEYVPLLAFDVDAAGGGELSIHTLEKAKKSPFVYAAFLSVSGQGLRVFMRSDSTLKSHKKYYDAGLNILSEVLEIPTSKILSAALKESGNSATEVAKLLKENEHLDCSTSNVSRLWFYSGLEDGEIYVNEEAQVLQLEVKKELNQGGRVTDLDKVRICREKVNRQSIPAGRNNYVFALACEFAKFGISQTDALNECLKEAAPDFTGTEINNSVASAYKTRATEFSDAQIAKYDKQVNGGKAAGLKGRAKGGKAPSESNDGKQQVKDNTGGKQCKFIAIRTYLQNTYDLRMNIVSLTLEAKLKEAEKWGEINEDDIICELMEQGFSGVDKPLMSILRSTKYVARYDPLKEYFNSLPAWDNSAPDYIKELASFVVTEDQEWFNQQFKKALVRMVACALKEIPFNKQCLIFKSGQNDGKTSFIRFLCPPELSDYITDHIDVENKDGRLALAQNLIINLDEYGAHSRREANKVKAFQTISTVKERLPYGKKPTTHHRRATFFASTNDDEILSDPTGSVRQIVFTVKTIKHDNGGPEGYNQNVDINKVYSQAVTLLRSGFNYQMTKAELAKSEANNKNYQVSSSESELLPEYFTPAPDKDAEGAVFKTTTDIHEMLQDNRKTILSRHKVGKALRQLGYQSTTYRVDGKSPRKGFWVLFNYK